MASSSKLGIKLRERNDWDYRKGNVHQAITNLLYSKWRSADGAGWSYLDLATWTRLEYGDLAALALLTGRYNQQVCNGGHAQYAANRYDEAHDLLETLLESLGLAQEGISRQVYEIVAAFRSGDFHSDDWDDDEDEDDDSFDLDARYSEVSNDWMVFLEDLFKEKFVGAE